MFLVLLVTSGAIAFQQELFFVQKLTEAGFPDLAETVLTRTLRDFPNAEKSAAPLRIRILIAKKKFDEAQKKIASLNNPPLLWLALAETANQSNRRTIAETAYKKYFESNPKVENTLFQAASNYGDLLESRGANDDAGQLYEQVLAYPQLKKTSEKKSTRPVKAKLAHLLVKKNPKRARKLCQEVQLGGLDLWFGQAVVTWANVIIDKKDWSEAQAALETQLRLLKKIEQELEAQGQPISLISPLSGARYFLGLCYEKAGKDEAALNQFYNVYAKYGDSEYGPDAQKYAKRLIEKFKKQGKRVQIDLGKNRTKMEQSAFRVARRLFFDKQHAEAIPAYLKALNAYPEGKESVTALRELTLSLIDLNDQLLTQTVAAYIGERFAAHEEAANALLAAGKAALDKNEEALAEWIYDCYFDSFPQNSRVPSVLYCLASLRRQNGDSAGETEYLNRIIEQYSDSPYWVRAHSRLAWNAYRAKNYILAASQFEHIVDVESDSEKQMRTRFALAESYRFSKRWEKAFDQFQTLEIALNDATKSYGVSEETLSFNRPFSEKSIFYQGTCLEKLGKTDAAVLSLDRLIQTFPESEFVPQARFAKGSALMKLKKYSEALATFANFDETSERSFFEPVLFYRGEAFYETDHFPESIQSLERLLTLWPESSFFYEAKLVQGRAYVAAGQNKNAVRVLSNILQFASDELLIHRASIELGHAQTDPSEKLASFQRVALLADPNAEAQIDLIGKALYESLPLYLELLRPENLLSDSDRLIDMIPTIGNSDEVTSWRKDAHKQLAQLKTDTVKNL